MSETASPPRSYYGNVRKDIEALIPHNAASILEIGCGAGATVAWLRTVRPIRYAAGVELDPAAGRIARGVFDQVEICDVDEATLAFSEDKFDIVLVLDVLEHLPMPWRVLGRLREKLAPGGVLIASIPNVAHYEASWPLFFRGRWDYREQGILDGTHLRFYTRDTAIALVEGAGLSVVKTICTKKFPNLFACLGLTDQRWRWYSHRIMRRILVWPRHWFDLQFLIAARRTEER